MKPILILSLLFFAGPLWAQADGAVVERRVIQDQEWEKAAGELDYSQDLPKSKKEEKPKEPSASSDSELFTGLMQLLGTLLQVLAVVLAIAVIGYGVYRMLQEPRNKLIARDGVEITEANLENYLHETDLERFLREALARRDYSQAIRLYYLQIIKQLSESGAIQWSKEKTNRDYLREMRSHPQAETFQQLTRIYERIWYGNVRLDAAHFATLEPSFKVKM